MDMPPLGSTFAAQYKISRLLGIGAVGVVFEAEQILLNRPVALKILSRSTLQDERSKKRFLTESKATSVLTHPNIVRGLAAGVSEDGYPFIATELIIGSSLADWLATELPDADSLKLIFSQIFNALEFAHKRGIIHRDLKPANIMLSETGELKLLDFGIAKILDTDAAGQLTGLDQGASHSGPLMGNEQSASQSQRFVGSPNYMSPEQIQGMKSDQRSDIYSLGILIYECLTGAAPFDSPSSMHVMYQHVNDAPPVLTARDTGLDSYALNKVVQKCLQKKPENRYQSIPELADELLPALDTQSHKRIIAGIARKSITLLLLSFLAFGALIFATVPRHLAKTAFGKGIAILMPAQGVGKREDSTAFGHRPLEVRLGRKVVTPMSLIYMGKHQRKEAEHADQNVDVSSLLRESVDDYTRALSLLAKRSNDRYLEYLCFVGRARATKFLCYKDRDDEGNFSAEGRRLLDRMLSDLDHAEKLIKPNSYEDTLISREKGELYSALHDSKKAQPLFEHALALKERSEIEMSPGSAQYLDDKDHFEEDYHDSRQYILNQLAHMALKAGNKPLREMYLKNLFDYVHSLESRSLDDFQYACSYADELIDSGKIQEAKAALKILEKDISYYPDEYAATQATSRGYLAVLYQRVGDTQKADHLSELQQRYVDSERPKTDH